MASHEPHRAHKLAVGGAVQGRSARKTAAEAAKIAEKARKTDELRRAIGDKLYGTLESMCGAKAFQLFDKDGDGTSLSVVATHTQHNSHDHPHSSSVFGAIADVCLLRVLLLIHSPPCCCSGTVTVKEVEAVCREYGLPTEHVKTFVDAVDDNKDGFLSVFELQDFFSKYERERVEDSTAAIRARLPKQVFARFRTLVDTPGFRALDRKQDGRVRVDDLEALCRRRNLPRAHVQTVVDLLTASGNKTLSLRAFQSIFKYSSDDQHRCGVSMERETLLAAERAHKTHLEHLKHGDIIGEYDAAVAALRPNKRLHQFLSDEVQVLMVDQWGGQKAKPGESQCKVQVRKRPKSRTPRCV